ncbi:hypothetical protein [Streptomyces albipurpureus]|uniref:hypothetical protein n=1 Tax=Streptomyces albipurpureus TaxID=2897419 RepID=UPI0020344C86|nr:hypothetical protein [Streptomyces sp. CWNU-1]
MEVSGPRALVRKVGVVNRPLVAVGAISGLITVAAPVGLAVDPREITGQAHRAQPLTSPDTATVTALTALAIAAAAATAAVFLHARTTRHPPMPRQPA